MVRFFIVNYLSLLKHSYNSGLTGNMGIHGYTGLTLNLQMYPGGGGSSALNLPARVSMKVMDMGLFLSPSE